MHTFTIPNQSSIPKASKHFPEEGHAGDQRLFPSGNRDPLMDCVEEFVNFTIFMRPHVEHFAVDLASGRNWDPKRRTKNLEKADTERHHSSTVLIAPSK
jgi:arsenic resistance protein ArsH